MDTEAQFSLFATYSNGPSKFQQEKKKCDTFKVKASGSSWRELIKDNRNLKYKQVIFLEIWTNRREKKRERDP